MPSRGQATSLIISILLLTSSFEVEARVPRKRPSEEEIAEGMLGDGPAERAEAPRLTLISNHTGEAMAIFREPPPPRVMNELFRCRVTGQIAEIPSELVQLILTAAEHFEADRGVIVSAYRSRKLNEMLRKKDREVARRSQHVLGLAVDFRLRGVSARPLGRWVRRHHNGGVGTYRTSNFVHIDTGRRRSWRGR